MPLTFNLRHLEKRDLTLVGEVSSAELELTEIDELIEVAEPIRYELEVERLSETVLVRGKLQCVLRCQCVRCLAPFSQTVDLADWTCDLPLVGEDKVVVNNDCVDLTPYVREDILLAFPQHPLCKPGCGGLPEAARKLRESASVEGRLKSIPSAWAELNKLKF